jgi:enoyl-CoA hydratase/carnithine racemase
MPSVDSPETVVRITVPSSLGQHALAQLIGELEGAMARPTVRAIVLAGTQERFCAGMDLSEISADNAKNSGGDWLVATNQFVRVLQMIRDASAITIAVVEGAALGGGVGLLAACDVVLATEQATFSLPELVLGLVPAMILPVLGERLGLHQAKRWAISQATWQAGDALTKGLVDQLIPADRVEVSVKRVLKNLVRLHPRGVVALKRFAQTIENLHVNEAIAEGHSLLSGLLSQPEVRNDVIAFRDYGILPGQSES